MIRLGITGHRPNRLQLDPLVLAGRVREVLGALVSAAADPQATGPVLDVQSPLAEGADQLVAEQALLLGQQLTALLPMAIADYEATFAAASARKPFRKLLAAASSTLTLEARARHRQAAFAAIGLTTVARSDLMLTIWDGKPADGPGGTPQILQSALQSNVPVIWIDAVRDRAPVLLRADPQDQYAGCDALTALARQAKPIAEPAYRALVAAVRAEAQ